MKKFAVVGLFVLVFVAYIFYLQANKGFNNGSSIPVETSSSSQSQNTALGLKDGQYTSSVGDAFFGPLQIKATINGGKISDIEFLQYPNDRPTSIQINESAIPVLKQEAITAQNSEVDNVTGATQTADAFKLLIKEVLQKAEA